MDYPWWDLDGCELASVLYNILAPFQLSDHTYQDWDDFVRKDPDFAYAWSVGLRLNVLEEAIIALRPIVQMLGVTEFPIPSNVRAIDRYVWLSAMIDLALFRISVIRDCCFVLVNEVFELGINPRELSFRRLKAEGTLLRAPVLDCLSTIGSIGKDLRAERNKRAHEGIQRSFGEDSHDTLIFKVAAMTEEMGTGTVQDFDLEHEYSNQVSLLYDTYVKDAETLRDGVLQLQELLVDSFSDRFEQKEASKQSAAGT
ncbi:MAG: hypothetical protein M3Q91_03475 [Acidobacteriota bacterium]|nr:hypothetical protein [Acidobacteriota bacterium]